jgi:hypothetical protein
MGFAAFRECIAIEQRRLLTQPYRRPTTSAACVASWWANWILQRRSRRNPRTHIERV